MVVLEIRHCCLLLVVVDVVQAFSETLVQGRRHQLEAFRELLQAIDLQPSLFVFLTCVNHPCCSNCVQPGLLTEERHFCYRMVFDNSVDPKLVPLDRHHGDISPRDLEQLSTVAYLF